MPNVKVNGVLIQRSSLRSNVPARHGASRQNSIGISILQTMQVHKPPPIRLGLLNLRDINYAVWSAKFMILTFVTYIYINFINQKWGVTQGKAENKI